MVVVMAAEAEETEVDGVVERVRGQAATRSSAGAYPGRSSAWSATSTSWTR